MLFFVQVSFLEINKKGTNICVTWRLDAEQMGTAGESGAGFDHFMYWQVVEP